jgi:hypothetical protein
MTDLDRLLQLHGSNGKMFNELKCIIEGKIEKGDKFDEELKQFLKTEDHNEELLEQVAKLKEELEQYEKQFGYFYKKQTDYHSALAKREDK